MPLPGVEFNISNNIVFILQSYIPLPYAPLPCYLANAYTDLSLLKQPHCPRCGHLAHPILQKGCDNRPIPITPDVEQPTFKLREICILNWI